MTDDSSQNDGKNPFEMEGLEGLNLDFSAMNSQSSDDSAGEALPTSGESFELPVDAGKQIDATADPAAPIDSKAPDAQPAPNSGERSFEQVKQFSEKLPMEKVQVPAVFPFSLLIEGELLPAEKEKLLDVISRERMGFREIDLEPQFAGNRVLIPRISEYAGVLLVQALRGTSARMRLGPSDSIFATESTHESSDPLQSGATPLPSPTVRHEPPMEGTHPAELIKITAGTSAGPGQLTVIDTLIATAVLKTAIVEAENTSEYREILDNLQRELKYRAYRKGAVAITHFKIQLDSLSLPTQYRLTVSGTAVKPFQLVESAPESGVSPNP